MKEDSPFGVLLIRKGEEAGIATTHELGTRARICDFSRASASM